MPWKRNTFAMLGTWKDTKSDYSTNDLFFTFITFAFAPGVGSISYPYLETIEQFPRKYIWQHRQYITLSQNIHLP